jgi:hypothetical protein
MTVNNNTKFVVIAVAIMAISLVVALVASLPK